nr:MAG TPA: hypothetical protein [Caudoviricetes sp.]
MKRASFPPIKVSLTRDTWLPRRLLGVFLRQI